MSIIKVKAKVKLLSEDDMEIEQSLEINNLKSKRWVWRSIAFDAEHIYKLINYSSDKSIIIMNDGEEILVKESFDDLFNLWINSLPEDLDLSDESGMEDFEIFGEEN